MGMSAFEYVQSVDSTAALRIEDFAEDGSSTTIVDNTDVVEDPYTTPDEREASADAGTGKSKGGCGCAVGGPSGATTLLPLLLLAGYRRRRH